MVDSIRYSWSWQFFWLGSWSSEIIIIIEFWLWTNKQTLFTRMLAITSLLLFVIPQTELRVQKLCATAIKAQILYLTPQWSFNIIYLIRNCSPVARDLLIPRKVLSLIFSKDTQVCKAKAIDGTTSAIVAAFWPSDALIDYVSLSCFNKISWIQLFKFSSQAYHSSPCSNFSAFLQAAQKPSPLSVLD